MASTIRIKRSSVAGKSPNTSNLSTGELALNLADKKIYSSNGTAVFEIGSDSFSNKKTFTVTNSGASAYSFSGVGTGEGFANSNPTLYLTRGETYTFSLNASGHPFYINTVNATGTGNQYANGVSGQGTQVGTLTFTVPMNAPKKLYYNCQYHSGMNGTIYIPNQKDIDASTFQTKSDAVTSNNTLVSLIEDRLQVANVQPLLDRYLQVANSSSFVTQGTLDGYLQVANGVQVINSVSTSLFSNNNLSVTTPLADLDFNDRVVANPNGHINFTTIEGYQLKVPYFSTPGVQMGDGTITVTAASNEQLDNYLQVANAAGFATTSQLDGYLQVANSTGFVTQSTLDNYLQVANGASGSTNSFGTINVDGSANLVAQNSNTFLTIIGTGGIVVTGYTANNTLTIDGGSVAGSGGGSSSANSVAYLRPTKLDDLTASATASYSLKQANVAYTPLYANGMIISLNGVIQEPGSAFTLSGSTLTFSETLNANDSIDFVIDYSTSALRVTDFANHLIPSVSNTYTIGTTTKLWKHIYATNVTVDNLNTTSDQALKVNIENAQTSGPIVDSIQVRQFDWKKDNTHQRYGLVAQELQTVMPEAVGTSDDYMTIDYLKLVPVLIKEIQELKARIEALENK